MALCVFLGGTSPAYAELAPDSALISEQELQEIQDSMHTTPTEAPEPTTTTVVDSPNPMGRILQSVNPDMAVILDVALAGFGGAKRTGVQGGGHDPRTPGFNLQSLEVHMDANVDPYFHFSSALVFGQEGVELEEAYATTLALPANLQLRAGQFLTRFGRINAMHLHQWNFVDQPLVIQKFMGTDGNRGLGIEGSWLSPLPWYLEAVVSASEPFGAATAASYYAGSEDHTDVTRIQQALWTGAVKQFFPLTNDLSLLWGLSAQTAPNAKDGRTALYGTDVYLRFRPLGSTRRQSVSLQIEAMLRDRSIPGQRRLQDGGGYVELLWSFDPRWEVGGRGEWMSRIANDFVAPDSPESRTRYAAQVTYTPSHFSRVRLQTSMDRPKWLSEPVYAVYLALEVSAGAHGAHSY